MAEEKGGLLLAIYNDLANPGVSAVGKAVGNVIDFALIPTLYLGFYRDKLKATFEVNLENYRKKLLSVPENKIVEANPQLSVPLLDRFAYTSDPVISDAFTNLLLSASHKDKEKISHPAFVKVIDSLVPDEAKIIKKLAGFEKDKYFSAFRVYTNEYKICDLGVTLFLDVEMATPENLDVYVKNLVSLGIIELDFTRWVKDDAHRAFMIKELVNSPSYLKKRVDQTPLQHAPGIGWVTEFGKMFIASCIAPN